MSRYKGAATAYIATQLAAPATVTLSGGATLEECLRTPGDGKYIRIRNGNTSTNGANEVKLRFGTWNGVPQFDPARVHGTMGRMRLRFKSLSKISGSVGLAPSWDVFNLYHWAGDTTPVMDYHGFSGGSETSGVTDFLFLCPLTLYTGNNVVTGQELWFRMRVGTSGGAGDVWELQIDSLTFEYGEADTYLDVPAATYVVRTDNGGTKNWTNPANGVGAPNGTLATAGVDGTSYSLDRFLPSGIALPGTFRGVDFLETLGANYDTTTDVSQHFLGLGHYPLSVPSSATPVSNPRFAFNNPEVIYPSGHTFATWGAGPDFDWMDNAVNGWAGLDLSRLLNGGYVLSTITTVRATPTPAFGTDAIVARIYYDRLPGGGPLLNCEA